MSKRKVTLAINNITNCLNQLKKNNPAVFDKTLRTLGVNKIVFERCYSLETEARRYKEEYTRLAEILKSKINSTIDNVSYAKSK